MTSVAMINEDQVSGRAKEIYDDIKSTLGIDFVPNMYKTMAVKPEFPGLSISAS